MGKVAERNQIAPAGIAHDAARRTRRRLARFSRVIELAEDHGLRVLVTGLNDFYPGDNPAWIGQLSTHRACAVSRVRESAIAAAATHATRATSISPNAVARDEILTVATTFPM